MSSPFVRSAPTTPQHSNRNVAALSPRSAGDGRAAASTRPTSLAAPPPPLSASRLEGSGSSPLAVTAAQHFTDGRGQLPVSSHRALSTRSEGFPPLPAVLSTRPTATTRPPIRSSVLVRTQPPHKPPSKPSSAPAKPASASFAATSTAGAASIKSSHVHLTISDEHSDTDVSVSVSLSRKGQPSNVVQHVQSATATSTASTASTASRSILSASVFGHGRWSVCSQLIVAGVAVTLLLALVTIPLLMMMMEVGAGGTDMQRHHLEDEEHGVQHVLRWVLPAALLHNSTSASVTAAPSPPAVSPADQAVQSTPTPAPVVIPVDVPSPSSQEPALNGPEAVTAAQTAPLSSPSLIALRPVDTSLSMESYRLPLYDPDTLPAVMHNLTLFTTFSPTYQHIPSTFPLRTWTLLFPHSPLQLLVYSPDQPTCDYLTITHALQVTCVPLSYCFDDRSKRRRRKPNKGSLWWEYDEDSRREGKIVCLLKDVDRRVQTPLVAYFDHEMLLAEDIVHALHTVINRRISRSVPSIPLTEDDVAAIRRKPFMLIGRTWEVDTSSRPRMSWKRQGDDTAAQKKKRAAKQPVIPEETDDDYYARLASNRERLHDWLSDVRAASILSQQEYLSTFPMADDVELYALHNTHPLHWFIYTRSGLPMHAISKSSYMSDGSSEHATQEAEEEERLSHNGLDLNHGWESFVVWSAKSKAHPPVQLIDVSDTVHVMHAHATAAHNHSEHAPPLSLLVFPDNANASDIARVIAAGNPLPNNPVAVPLSPANAYQRLQCDWVFPSEACELVGHREAELDALIESRASEDRQLILLMVNADYLPLAYNWLCRARELSISSYLFIAEDRISYFSLLSRNIPVTLVHYARHRKRAAFTNTNSSWLFDETNYYRSIILHRAHQHHNLSVLLLHLDLVLFDDPLPLLLPNPHACDVLVPMNGSFPSGGLFYFPTTPLGRRLVHDIVGCEEENVQFAHVYGGNRFVFSDDKEATCLYQLVTRLITRHHFRRCTFDPFTFPSESDFFAWAKPQRVGVWPMAVHVEQQKSIERKERVMKEWRMWRWSESEMDGDEWMSGNSSVGYAREDERLLHPISLQWRQQRAERWAARGEEGDLVAYVACLPTPDEMDVRLLPEPDHGQGSPVIHLHLLARGDDKQLSATIDSLKALVPAAALSVHLHVDLSALPASSDARSNAANVSHLLLDLEGMQWKHGHKYVRSFKQSASVDAEWIRSWTEVREAAKANSTHLNASVLCLTMQAGQLVSPHAFVLLASLLSSHSLHLDTHLFSIALLHHPHILGETPTWRYGSRAVTSLVSASVPAYLYQLSSLSGSVFFLSTLLRFLHFYDEHIAAIAQLDSTVSTRNITLWPSTFPCVPSLVSNRWYLSRPAAHFDQYLHRFTFDYGLYTLHFNLRGSRTGRLAHRNNLCTDTSPSDPPADECNTPLVLLIDDPSQVAVSTRVALLSESVMSSIFPPLYRLPLYDFQFNSVEVGVSVLERRSTMFAPHNPLDRTSGTAADDPAAEEEIQRQLVSDEVDDEDEDDAPPVPTVPGAAGTAAEEEVKEKVKRHVDAIEAQNINAILRALISAQQRTRKQRVPAASNPLGLVYPGSLQDRCFVLGSASDVWQDEEDVEMQVRPYIPPSTHPAYMGLVNYHRHLAQTHTALLSSAESVKDARVLVYQPKVPVGVPLDRQLRGLYFAFVLSLCLERMLLIDMIAMRAVFDPPIEQTWLHAAHQSKLRSLPSQVINASHAYLLRSSNLEDKFDAPVVYYHDLISHDRQLFSNPRYRWLPLVLFQSQSRAERTGQVMRHLLSQPSRVLLREAEALMNVLHLRPHGPTKAVIAVRLDFADDVPPATAEQPLPNVTAHYLQCVHSMLSTLAPHPNATRLLFVTNRPTKLTFDAMSSLLSPFGSVVTYADSFKRIKSRMAQLLTGVPNEDASSVTLAAEVLVGYVLAELEVALVTDTTFGLFYTARNGYNSTKQYTVLVTEDTKAGGGGDGYCGPIRRLDRPKRMDIVY